MLNRSVSLCHIMLVGLVLCGCKKEQAARQPASAPGKPVIGSTKSPGGAATFDTKAAEEALIATPWQGVVGGKPALLITQAVKGGLACLLMQGNHEERCTVSVDKSGEISIQTTGRPTPRGLAYLQLGGKLARDHASVSGTVSHVVKAGFVEQASGGGEFELKKGDAKTAIAFYESACKGGNPTGCFSLGAAYFKGDGVAKDSAKMVDFFKKACVGGMARSCGILGKLFFTGEGGVKKNLGKAMVYWGKACDDGDLESCRNMGDALVAKSFKKGVRQLKRACDGGDAMGCNNLGWNLAEKGKGRQLDQALAASQKAVKLDARAGFIDTLAYVYFRRKEYERAEMEALRALKLDPNVAEHKKRLEDIRAAMKKGK
jgi:hypothetical protein